MEPDLKKEAEEATKLLKDKIVSKVDRHRIGEVCIEFNDGTRLFIDTSSGGVEISIT